MRILTIIILSLSFLSGFSQTMWEIKSNNEVVKWKYHSGDEFDGTKIKENFWHTGPPYGRANMILNSYHSEKNIIVKDHVLQVLVDSHAVQKTIEPWLVDSSYLKKNNITPVNGLYNFKYTVGMIWSKPFYKYGYFELRFKADKGQGLWPAFWLYGRNSIDEIDFFELKGEKLNQVHLDVHCKSGCDKGYKYGWRKINWGGWVDVKKYLSDGYNTISGIWEPGYVTWYLNGYMIGKFKGDFETSMSLIINTALTKDKYAFSPGPNATTPFPSGMTVDYVRVFGKPDTTKTLGTVPFAYIKDTTGYITPTSVKTKKYIFNRKRDDNVQGFISYYRLSNQKILFEVKGKISQPTLRITNSEGKEIITQPLNKLFNEVDISRAGHGDFTMIINVSGKKLIEEKIHLGH